MQKSTGEMRCKEEMVWIYRRAMQKKKEDKIPKLTIYSNIGLLN